MPTTQKIQDNGDYDTALSRFSLLKQRVQSPRLPEFDVFDSSWIIPLARSMDMGVVGIRSHAAGALTDALDRPGTSRGRVDAKGPSQHGKVGFPAGRTYREAVAGDDGRPPDELGYVVTTVLGVKNRP